jgi:hypothetical protein
MGRQDSELHGSKHSANFIIISSGKCNSVLLQFPNISTLPHFQRICYLFLYADKFVIWVIVIR